MASGHSGWSFWKASAMAERSASTQTVILAVGSCVTVGKPYVLPVEEPADAVGPLLGVAELVGAAELVGVPEPAVPVGLSELPEQPATTSAMEAAAADTPINRSCKDMSLLPSRFVDFFDHTRGQSE